MFGIYKKTSSQTDKAQKQIDDALEKMGASVLLITQSGKIVMVADHLKSKPHDWLGGQAIEVMICHPKSDPYFIYYENEKYYFSMARGQQSLSNLKNYGEYRSNVAQLLCVYLVNYLVKTQGKDISDPKMSFSHNRIHTNVIAYVSRLRNWYPIQHSSEESDSASEEKVAQVNSGLIDITDVIAIYDSSPA